MAVMVSSVAMAQTQTRVPYFMGFENNEAAELSNWHLNPGSAASSCMDQWTVGNATHSSGTQSLYISTDGGVNAQYGFRPNLQYVYRDFYLPAGKYDLSFDWKNIGAAGSFLGAGYSNASNLSNMTANATSATIPQLIRAKLQGNPSALFGADEWQNAIFTVQSDGVNAVRVFFAWSNNNADSASCTLGACVDNIQLTTQACTRPSNINATVVSCDTVNITWTGASLNYECYYRQVGTEYWHAVNQVNVSGTKGSCVLDNMSEGSYDIRVRGICTPDTSAWTYLSGVVIYCIEKHCVNFTDLYAPNVTCTYGTTNSQGYEASKQHAYDHIGVKDYGSDDMRSQHTVNWDNTATDPRTGGDLPLIPKGGYASVRLGNWDVDYGAESITYEYTVDSTKSVLLMQYAIVLEYPSGHGEDAVPRFVLEVLDEQGRQIDPTCGVREFWAEEARGGWKSYRPQGAYDDVVYKPWTTVGLNLDELGVKDGDKIRVRLTTYDCFWSAHYGYAYFTLDCASATIESKSCAKDPGAGMTLKAPDGFTYQWYDRFGTALPGETKAEFTPNDTATYRCRLTSTEEKSCYFDLYSQCVPRLPVPQFNATYAPSDCLNRVTIKNGSHVIAVLKHDTVQMKNDRCDSYLWTIWGTDFPELTNDREEPVFTFPQAGGTFYIKLTASLSGGCEEELVQKIIIPEIGNYDAGVIDTTICEGSFIQWGGTVISETGVYNVHTYSKAGCDSVATMDVFVAPRQTIVLDTVQMCYGDYHYIGDDAYHCIKSGMHMVRYLSSNKCDSVVMQYVLVKAPILPIMDITQIDVKQGVLFGKIVISGTGFDYYTLNDERKEITETVLDSLPAGSYRFSFFNDFGCRKDTTVRISAGCIDALFSRWGNVLSLMNKTEYARHYDDTENYEFTNFQWYFNDKPISGATLSYFEETNGSNGKLRNGEYYLAMTRVATGERCKTCTFDPRDAARRIIVNEVSTKVYPTMTNAGGEVYVLMPVAGSAELYSVLGEHVESYSLAKGMNTLIAPMASGVYVLNILIGDTRETVKLQIK